MSKIQKASSYLLFIFNALLIGAPTLVIIQWFFMEAKTADVGPMINFFGLLERTVETPEGLVNLSAVPWTPLLKAIGLSSDILGILPFLLGLFLIKPIFQNYQKGDIFSTANAIRYQYLSWLFFIDALFVKSLSHTLLIFAVTLSNPPGHRYIHVQFGTPNMKALFYGALVIVIAWVMREASNLHDDQKLTI